MKAAVDAMSAKLAPATVRTNLAVLRALLNAAVEADVIGRSLVRGVRVRKAPTRERPTLTPEELGRLADQVGPFYRGLILIVGVIVFVGPKGSPLRRSFAARLFAPAVSRAGLPDTLTFHGLRHVATTFTIEAGIHPRVIQHRLGHSPSRLSMELDAHVPEPADRAVAERLEERFAQTEGRDSERIDLARPIAKERRLPADLPPTSPMSYRQARR